MFPLPEDIVICSSKKFHVDFCKCNNNNLTIKMIMLWYCVIFHINEKDARIQSLDGLSRGTVEVVSQLKTMAVLFEKNLA